MGPWIAVRLSMGVSDMKKFLLNIAIFFAIVAAVDFSMGYAFQFLQARTGGRTGSEYHVCKEGEEEILVMGSSRASHHYVSTILADSLGLSCYNGGQDGNGIVMQYGRWKMISKRYIPKLIIYDLEPSFDMKVSDNIRFVDRLKPFANEDVIYDYISDLYPIEKWKLMSSLYRYNYKFLEIFSDCGRKLNKKNGYLPLYNHIKGEIINTEKPSGVVRHPLDRVKIDCLTRLIKEVKASGSEMIIVSSPYWRGCQDVDFSSIQELAESNGVLFLNYCDSEIRNNPDFFADSMHLNDKGAMVFTLDIIQKIKSIICQS